MDNRKYRSERDRKRRPASGRPVRRDDRSYSRTAGSAKRAAGGKKRRRRRSGGRILLAFISLLILVCVVGTFAGMKLFEKKAGQSLLECIAEGRYIALTSKKEDFAGGSVSYVYDRDKKQIAKLSMTKESVRLDYNEIPEDVVNAFVAIEDRTFWTNSGVDVKGIARVLFNYAKSLGKQKTGASTITQQLVKLTYLSSEKTLSRKVKEIVIARELTKKYTKQEIMSYYCNACCFANGIYGISDAAKSYFGKTPDELTLSECAYLCAIPNWPEHYNPRTNPENALERRDKILKDMKEEGYISEAACKEALAEEIRINEVAATRQETHNFETTYAVNCAAKVIMERQDFRFRYTFDSEEDYRNYQNEYEEAMNSARHELYTGGYKIYTTIDSEAQRQMQAVLDDALADKDKKLESGIYQVQGSMTVIDNSSGKVVAVIGGRSQAETSGMYTLNRAYQGYAQPGSSIKPLVVYAAAMDTGDYNTASYLRNIDVTAAKKNKYKVSQIREMDGDDITLRSAVENSLNGCAYWLFSQIGIKSGMEYLHNMEFARIVPSDENMSACLGGLTYGVTTEEMANAYSTLANGGTFRDTDCLSAIQDRNGNDIYELPEEKDIYSVEASRRMTSVMKGVLTRGTAKNSDWYDYTSTEAAGKTGTTNDNKAAWFCGYTPYYTIAVWVGCDTPTVVKGLNGNSYPLRIWQRAMLKMIDGKPTAYLESIEDKVVEESTELPECTCTGACSAELIDPDCPLCAMDYTQCRYLIPCICEEKCEGDSLNELCPACILDPGLCVGHGASCICTVKCTADSYNPVCPLCAQDIWYCIGQEPEPEETTTAAPPREETKPTAVSPHEPEVPKETEVPPEEPHPANPPEEEIAG